MVIPPPERRDRDIAGSRITLAEQYLEGVRKVPAHLVPRFTVGAKNDEDDDSGLGWWNASTTPPALRDDSAAAARQ